MYQNVPVLLGQYRPLDSFLHRLDVRSKIIPVTLVLILALMTGSLAFYLVILATLIAALLLSGVGCRTLLNNFRPVFVLVLMTALYHLVFSERESAVVVELFGWELTEGALHLAGFYSLRLALFICIAFLITLTSSPSDLAEALTKMLRPLAWLRIPVQELGMIMFMAIRFIPILYEEFLAIRYAQMIRGVDFSGSLVSRLRKTTFIIIPVFVAAIQRADDVALAIEVRGYNGRRLRTFYSRVHFGEKEWLFLLGTAAFVVSLFVVTL
jgi:energy-coupling factor transport system permease protein